MITRICIEGYKSYKKLDQELGPVCVLLGPNGSGKSNLLDAIQLMANLVNCRTLADAFQRHRGRPLESYHYGEQGYDNLVKKKRVRLALEVDVHLSDAVMDRVNEQIRRQVADMEGDGPKKKFVHERRLRYRVAVEATPETGHLRVAEERFCALKRGGVEKKSRNPFLEPVKGEKGRERIHLRAESQAHPTYHELGLGHTLSSSPLYAPHYPHIMALREELYGWKLYRLEPTALMGEGLPAARADDVGVHGEHLTEFLSTLAKDNVKAFETFQRSLNVLLPGQLSVNVKQRDDGRQVLQLGEGARTFSPRLVSEGTLRMVGLLSAVFPAAAGTVLCCEEPENGVHPARLKVVAELFRQAAKAADRQIIVTTHSPVLADHFEDHELLICRKEKYTSRTEPFQKVDPVMRRSTIVRALQEKPNP